MQQAAKEKTDSTKYSVEDRLSKQTESLNQAIDYEDQSDDQRVESQGSDPMEDPSEMGIDWSDTSVDGLYLAADLAMIVEDNQDEHTPKYVHERKRGQKKKKPTQENSGHGFGMEAPENSV